ncbi:hypothetical protein [Rufibacter sp. XAAS-G3-1]|uniref:hypothetical protein n=1 Tax=Rufibacter sp. XAAS-G3-1 TaxID=2729134 RepID=UPI0015E63119|nr:hypothetical protein [Rufibacter sp. XAAS-G3-1]
MTSEDFRKHIVENPFEDVLSKVLLGDYAKHVTAEQLNFIKKKIAEKFKISVEEIEIIVVGSAKLGFSITEKWQKDSKPLPRYRLFGPNSDIDLAIICQPLFELIWNELATYSYNRPRFPWTSEKFGDYLVCGWIRPDHFPKSVILRRCDDWWSIFSFLSSTQFLGRRKIRAGLFFNIEQLGAYQGKALKECITYENL